MKLEIQTSEDVDAVLDIFYMPKVHRFEDGTKTVDVDIYSATDNHTLQLMGWGFDYDVYERGEIGSAVTFSTDGTMITTETMLSVLRGYFGDHYIIEIDPVSFNNENDTEYNPEISISPRVFFYVVAKATIKRTI
jgi:hypothetical protein